MNEPATPVASSWPARAADPIEAALAGALAEAFAEGRLGDVAQLAKELAARRAGKANTIDFAGEARRRAAEASNATYRRRAEAALPNSADDRSDLTGKRKTDRLRKVSR